MINLSVIVILNFFPPFNHFYEIWTQFAQETQKVYKNINFIFTTSHEIIGTEKCTPVQLPSGKIVYEHPDDEFRLISQVSENYDSAILLKTWNAIEYTIMKHNPDFILRTNACSIWHWDRYLQILDSLPQQKIYGGFPFYHEYCPFISGAGTLMSKDMAQLLITFPITSKADDVYIGEILHQKCQQYPSFHGKRLDNIDINKTDQEILADTAQHYHIRFRRFFHQYDRVAGLAEKIRAKYDD